MNNDGKNRYFRGESSFTGENADREWPENYRRGLESSRENFGGRATRAVTGLSSGDSGPPRYQLTEPMWCCRTRPNKILLVHGLEHMRPAVNCDRVFNLFCLYGNVSTVKILKDDKVLVELEDVEAAKRCVSNLHLLPLNEDGHKMKVKYSKHFFICDQVMFNKLPDGTPAQKVYLSSKLNRFPGNGVCLNKRRVASPSKILHFFNAPIDVCGLTIHKTVSDALGRTDAIRSITILPKKPGAKCSTGLIQLKSIVLAVRTIFLSNHMIFESTRSRFPFLTKLCFSKWSEIQRTPADSATLRFSSTPRMPWLLHNSELSVPTTEFPISRTTVVTESGGGGGGDDEDDGPWTLWSMEDDELQDVEIEDSDRTPFQSQTDQVQPIERIRQRFPDDIDKFLLDMLRARLCANNDDQGDMLLPVTRTVPEDAVAVASPQAAGGPLGDS